jgi:hypothetical protein
MALASCAIANTVHRNVMVLSDFASSRRRHANIVRTPKVWMPECLPMARMIPKTPPSFHGSAGEERVAYLGHRNIQHTVRYTELSQTRFKDFWRN